MKPQCIFPMDVNLILRNSRALSWFSFRFWLDFMLLEISGHWIVLWLIGTWYLTLVLGVHKMFSQRVRASFWRVHREGAWEKSGPELGLQVHWTRCMDTHCHLVLYEALRETNVKPRSPPSAIYKSLDKSIRPSCTATHNKAGELRQRLKWAAQTVGPPGGQRQEEWEAKQPRHSGHIQCGGKLDLSLKECSVCSGRKKWRTSECKEEELKSGGENTNRVRGRRGTHIDWKCIGKSWRFDRKDDGASNANWEWEPHSEDPGKPEQVLIPYSS